MTYSQIVNRILMKLPCALFEPFSKVLLKSEQNREWIEKERIRNYAIKLMADFEGECRKIAKKKRIMVIREGNYGYSYFNVAFTNNVVNLILYAMYRGYIPDVQINAEKADTLNHWEWYFLQPLQSVFSTVNKAACKVVECDRKDSAFSYSFDDLFNLNSEKCKIFRFLNKQFLQFNADTNAYCTREQQELDLKHALGVIVRGTDYTATKPKWHPVQPEIEDVVAKLKEEWASGQYSCVYVATEEKRLFDIIAKEFGKERVFTLQKEFYDDIYYGQDLKLIGDVKFQRENDNYLKGIEYLSSLMALSKCRTVVGGNCGGTMLALFMAEDDQKQLVFNLGLY